MSWEEDFIEACMQPIENPEWAVQEGFCVRIPPEKIEQFKREWNEWWEKPEEERRALVKTMLFLVGEDV